MKLSVRNLHLSTVLIMLAMLACGDNTVTSLPRPVATAKAMEAMVATNLNPVGLTDKIYSRAEDLSGGRVKYDGSPEGLTGLALYGVANKRENIVDI